MKNRLNKIIALTLACGVIGSATAMAEEEIKVYIDGEQLSFDVNPTIYEERTLVPMRAIFEALGAEVEWNQETKTASAVRGNDTMSITIDSKQLYKNNEAVELDVPAMIIDDRTLVPVRAISESFDADVDWQGETQSVIITTKPELTPTAEPTKVPENTSGFQLSEEDMEMLKAQKEVFRYNMEQSRLPQYFFENSDSVYSLLSELEKFAETIFEYWDSSAISFALEVCSESKTEYVIDTETAETLAEKFADVINEAGLNSEAFLDGVSCFESDKGTRAGVIIFKSADHLVQCKCLGIVASKDGKPRYFTLENDVIKTDTWFLCEVTENGRGTIGVMPKNDGADYAELEPFAQMIFTKYEK